MKKILTIVLTTIVGIAIFFMSYDYRVIAEPNTYYRVYLDDQIVGKIKDKQELYDYFYKKGEELKEVVIDYKNRINLEDEKEEISVLYNQLKTKLALQKHISNNNLKFKQEILDFIENTDEKDFKKKLEEYMLSEEDYNFLTNYVSQNSIYLNTTKVSIPKGVEIKKVTSFDNEINEVQEVYDNIIKYKSATVDGYRLTIKRDNNREYIYVTNEKIFTDAVKKVIESFVGADNYELYINNEQLEIVTTGKKIEDIYINETITIKKTKMPLNERIYINSTDLSKYLLYGTTEKQKVYTVKIGDTLESVAYDNQISVGDLLISNPNFTSSSNLLSEGRKINIGYLNPKMNIVVKKTQISDVVNKYVVTEQKDANRVIGDDEIIQTGIDGLDRVTYEITEINGQEEVVKISNKVELKPVVNQIVLVGSKYQSTVGTLSNWRWPTLSGYYISSPYGYRYHPISGVYKKHDAIDIAIQYGTRIYAANNGVIYESTYNSSYGYYITINHNNGYYTRYAHMSKQYYTKVGTPVGKGTVIGLVGQSGSATGPHVHFEVWVGAPYAPGSYTINPLRLYR